MEKERCEICGNYTEHELNNGIFICSTVCYEVLAEIEEENYLRSQCF